MHTITLGRLPIGEIFRYRSKRKEYLLFKSNVEVNGKIICYTYSLRQLNLKSDTLVRVRKTVEPSFTIPTNQDCINN